MDSTVKALWVSRLRSGDYKQCHFQLRDLDDHYDPCGVLCELAVAARVIPPPVKHDAKDSIFFGWTFGDPLLNDRQATGLPKAVCEWSGVPYRDGYHISLKGDKGMKFNELADWIEENL